jgi:diguanylate cyclase (GGDEF)-like protein/PAS domain S-box-containing protein
MATSTVTLPPDVSGGSDASSTAPVPAGTILLIEDNADDAHLVMEMLKENGHSRFPIRHLTRLKDALALSRREPVDAILLDLSLPDTHGITGVAPLRAAFPTAPIVILTGWNDEALALEALGAGAEDYLCKNDLTADLLLRALRYAARRKSAEQALAASEQRYRSLVDNSLGLICTHDAKGLLLSVNPAAAQLLGYGCDELVGINLRELIPPERGHLFDSYLQRVFDHGRDNGLMTICDRGGGHHIFAYHNALVRDSDRAPYVIGYAQNVTEHRRAEAALRESEARFRALATHAPVGIVMADARGNWTYANEHWCGMVGLPSSSVLGDGWMSVLHPDDRETALSAWRNAINTTRECSFEHRYRTVDGDVVWMLNKTVALRDAHDVVSGYLCTVTDISGRKRDEEVLRQLSLRDELTGLYNRRGFLTHAEQCIKSAKRCGAHLILLFIDLDGMKRINDLFGRQEGDHALVNTAILLRRAGRESDVIARLGGDEFALILVATQPNAGTLIERRLQRMLVEHNRSADLEYTLSMSIGVTQHDPASGKSIDVLLAEADAAMYERKRRKTGK